MALARGKNEKGGDAQAEADEKAEEESAAVDEEEDGDCVSLALEICYTMIISFRSLHSCIIICRTLRFPAHWLFPNW